MSDLTGYVVLHIETRDSNVNTNYPQWAEMIRIICLHKHGHAQSSL